LTARRKAVQESGGQDQRIFERANSPAEEALLLPGIRCPSCKQKMQIERHGRPSADACDRIASGGHIAAGRIECDAVEIKRDAFGESLAW
jgi:hypothetical protein